MAKAAWNFRVEPISDERSVVITETRVRCTDDGGRRRFVLYWAVIGPFSAVIRRRALGLIDQDAEGGRRPPGYHSGRRETVRMTYERAHRRVQGPHRRRREDRGRRLDARRVPPGRAEVHRDARELRGHGRAARGNVDPARADAQAQALAHREGPGRGRATARSCTGWPRTSGKSREAMFDDLVNGRTKFHNVFHYPAETWGDVAYIGWLIDGAALVTQKALLDSSYAPYVRAMRRICAEESLHLRHGEELALELVSRHAGPAGAVPGRREPVVAADHALLRPAVEEAGTCCCTGGSRRGRTRDLRQEFFSTYVPKLWDVGHHRARRPDLAWDERATGRVGLVRAELGRVLEGGAAATVR